MRIIAILQARLGSARLPRKILLPLGGQSMLQNIVERVSRATRLDGVCIAHPEANTPDHLALKEVLMRCDGIHEVPYTGDANDLVGRYVAAADAMRADLIVRVPCDNPCVDPDYLDAAVKDYLENPHIFYSNTTDAVLSGDPARGTLRTTWLDGIGVEVFSRSRLQWLDQITQGQPTYREHPHLWFQEHGCYRLPDADLRLDINTAADYQRLSTLYDLFEDNTFTASDIVAALQSHASSLAILDARRKKGA